MSINKIAIIGAGLMGSGIAQVFAAKPDLNVNIFSLMLEDDPYGPIKRNINIMLGRDVMTQKEADGILSRITFKPTLEDAVKDADFIIECVSEVMDLKQDLFAEIEDYCSEDAILATNTSVLKVTEVFSKCKIKSRVVGCHFWNPGHLIPLVEVVKIEGTSDAAIDTTMELLLAIGKRPILCKKDVPGFIGNRLQFALWREAIHMIENDIADPQTIDDAVKFGPGLRWPILGPIEACDMIGMELSYNILKNLLPHLADNHEPSPLIKEMLDRGDLGFKTGKGWQEWTPEQIEASTKRLREHLIDYSQKNR
jgi:3-hydroxybutyryl-CoA dehydrogenase